MQIAINLNGDRRELDIEPRETLFLLLRRLGIRSVKFGSEDGADGYSAVLLNGKLCNSVVLLAAQADGAEILTVEGLQSQRHLGWNREGTWHPLQRAFIETGAIQSGYDTPALILAGKALLDRNPQPTESEIRTWMSGNLCRCTGYDRIVRAVQAAAERLATIQG
mgnify:CR=1 FL=1